MGDTMGDTMSDITSCDVPGDFSPQSFFPRAAEQPRVYPCGLLVPFFTAQVCCPMS